MTSFKKAPRAEVKHLNKGPTIACTTLFSSLGTLQNTANFTTDSCVRPAYQNIAVIITFPSEVACISIIIEHLRFSKESYAPLIGPKAASFARAVRSLAE